MSQIITRFAPSPTGFLHIGGGRTALFNYLFAKHHKGKFLLRIEDTDEKRSTKEAVNAIVEGMKWLGLTHDDQIIMQSHNLKRHQEVAYQMLERGSAYLCYTAIEELDEMRKKAESKQEVFKFKSPWRDKANSQSSSVKPVIRVKAPLDGETIIEDLVQGKVTVKNSELDDLVILRGDKTPTYMLAVVVDDYDMNITHIIRGDDHLTNAFRQSVIYKAMEWEIPKFAHIPLIHGSDGAKMSKRHGATGVEEYKNMGYLPEAIRNYLLRLGWSNGDQEIISDSQAIELFSLERVGKSPSRFDFAKLNNLNKHYLKQRSNQELFELALENFKEDQDLYSKFLLNRIRVERAINFIKERSNTILEIVSLAKIYISDFTSPLNQEDSEKIAHSKILLKEISTSLKQIESWSCDEIKNSLAQFADQKLIKLKDFGPIIRIALTFSSSSPGNIVEVLELLGKGESLRRIEATIRDI